tara:strand:+ start:3666 stop:3851 length:186 start_codon:yes stop_codon:yes gene_type:complete
MSNVVIELSTSYVGTEKSFDTGYSRGEWELLSESDRWDIIHEKMGEYVGVGIKDGDQYLEI